MRIFSLVQRDDLGTWECYEGERFLFEADTEREARRGAVVLAEEARRSLGDEVEIR